MCSAPNPERGRAEIDAVVLAAEESIPEDLLAERIDIEAAQDRLHDRGLDEGVAVFAVEVWRYALGMLAADAEPPSLRNSLDVSSRPAVTDPAPASLSDELPPPVGKPTTISEPPDAADTVDNAHGDDSVANESTHKKRSWVLGSAAVVGVAMLVVLVGAALWLARDNGGTETEARAATAPESTAATTTVAPSTTLPTALDVEFDVETTPVGDLTRTWHIEDGELAATLAFVNSTGAATTGRYYEVLPKSLAATADQIVSEPPHTVYKNDPVIGWELTIEPGATAEVSYTVAVPADVSQDALEAMKVELLADAAAFVIERAIHPPSWLSSHRTIRPSPAGS